MHRKIVSENKDIHHSGLIHGFEQIPSADFDLSERVNQPLVKLWGGWVYNFFIYLYLLEL